MGRARRRIRGERGKRRRRQRGELLERPLAHCYETGGRRRTPRRHHRNILKGLRVDVAGGKLGLLRRSRLGLGTPRGLQGLVFDLWDRGRKHYQALWRFCQACRQAELDSQEPHAVLQVAC